MVVHKKPFVLWAQKENVVSLKIDLKDCQDPSIEFRANGIHFTGEGVGASGCNIYEFQLEFYKAIDPKKCSKNITDHHIELEMPKKEKSWWPRLTVNTTKIPWLKVNYDRFESEDTQLLNDEDEESLNSYPGLKDLLKDNNKFDKKRSAATSYRLEYTRMSYLIVYNLFMFIGFGYITIVLFLNWLLYDTTTYVYGAVSPTLKMLQLLQFLEVLHPIFGYTKGSAFMPFVQIAGRCFILFAMLDCEPRIQTMPVTYYLFTIWSAIEIIRYPYYLTQIMKKEIKLLTWIRYTSWVPLYPLGFMCEAVIIFRNLIFIDHSQKWSFNIPFIDHTFSFSTILRVYLLLFLIPAMYVLLRHMYVIRKKKLGLDTSSSSKKLSKKQK